LLACVQTANQILCFLGLPEGYVLLGSHEIVIVSKGSAVILGSTLGVGHLQFFRSPQRARFYKP